MFVAGHPGSTDRQLTVAELKSLRDRRLPPALLRSSELRGRYIQFAKTSAAEERIVRDALNGLENGIKVQRRELDALLDDDLLAAKRSAEADLRRKDPQATNGRRSLGAHRGRASREQRRWLPYVFIENAGGFNSRLFRYARQLVRAAAERPKPNTQRLREYADAALPRIEQQLAAPVPIYPELERLTLSFALERMREWLGPDDAVVRQLLTDETPDSLAARLVDGSKLADPAVRLALWKGGQAAIDASNDPMIALAKRLDANGRELRKWHEDEVEAVVEAAHEQIARRVSRRSARTCIPTPRSRCVCPSARCTAGTRTGPPWSRSRGSRACSSARPAGHRSRCPPAGKPRNRCWTSPRRSIFQRPTTSSAATRAAR